MILTARRCLGRLALLALATATPVDYAADHVVFAHLRTGEGNRAFRDAQVDFHTAYNGHAATDSAPNLRVAASSKRQSGAKRGSCCVAVKF